MGPPPIPKGSLHPMCKAIRPESVPPGKLWVQGKLRDKASQAAEHERQKQQRIAERAVRRPNLGKKIYAYNHIYTKQVVYSLTKTLEESKILPQLLFHGKKTVPASVRQDLWLPFFSVHFPTTKHGLIAYKQLRELSLTRQLAPPKALLQNSKNFDPEARAKLTAKKKARQVKKYRAKVLMDQKATSVADLALVLSLQEDVGSSKEKPLQVPRGRQEKLTRREKRKIRKRGQVDESLRRQHGTYASVYEGPKLPGTVTFSKETRSRIAAERDTGAILSNISQTKSGEGSGQSDNVLVAWADLRDGLHANWPTTVVHEELERKGGGIGLNVHVIGNIKQHREVLVPSQATDMVEATIETPKQKSFTSTVADTLMFWKR